MKLDVHDLTFIPVSALHGDNVVDRSANMPWYEGASLLHHLEEVHIASRPQPHRRPVPGAVRDPPADQTERHHDYRGYAGQVAGGVFKPGDEVVVLPVGLHLDDRLHRHRRRPGRRGVLADVGHAPAGRRDRHQPRRHDRPAATTSPTSGQDIDAMVCWMSESTWLREGAKLAIKHTTRWARALVKDLQYRLDVNTLHRDEDAVGSRSTRSGGSRCAPRSRSSSTSTAATGPRAASSSSTRPPTPPSAPG